jgi:thiol-disulfide isomerase/thioredoxin
MQLLRRNFLAGAAAALALPLVRAAGPTGLYDHGPAPEFAGITEWHNTPPLSLAALRGQVVLVDFWTYACVNCLRTLPHVNRWAAQYRSEGLVVVGVHTPEFAFERSASNLKRAMERHGVKHPVAQDNAYATWKAWQNQYWPAKYLVDRGGRVRRRHFGEGDYAGMEGAIRELLALRAPATRPTP